jgi:hypothetical protein
MAVFFLAVGSAWAIPFADVTVEGNVLTYDVTNDLTGFGIYRVGFGLAANSVDGSWVLPTGVIWSATNGFDWFNVDPYIYGVDSINGIKITYTDVPDVINYMILVIGQSAYTGSGLSFYKQDNNGYMYYLSGRLDTTSAVPEPATLLMMGLGLLGLAGVRKKFHK